ncbi:glycosyltransferase family 61 protein [Methylobacterium radiodurans]|nr:glycosyltransferase family 61 protein [Methylobacterium radiodurans]
MTPYVSCAPDRLYPPAGSIDAPEAVADLRAAGAAAAVLEELYPAWRYDWPMPETLHLHDVPAPPAMRLRFSRSGTGHAPAVLLVRLDQAVLLRNVLYIGELGRRRVIYESHRPEERALSGALEPEVAAEDFPTGTGPCLYVGNQGSFNYGHWLCEDLPRLSALDVLRARYPGERITLLLPRQDWHNNRMRERSVRLWLGDARDVVLRFIDPETAYGFPQLHWVTPIRHLGLAKSPDALARLDAVLRSRVGGLRSAALGPRLAALLHGRRRLRLFVDRNRLRQRELLNRAAILPLLRTRGFTIVDTERMEVADQVALFAAAEAVVGIKGAGLVNTVFSPPGTPVVHLAPETFQDPYYRDIAAARAQPYHVLYGTAAPGERRDHLRDFTIAPDDLAAVLDQLRLR